MPVNYQNWVRESTRLGKFRSADLIRVDQAVARFGNAPTILHLQALADAILDWRDQKGSWITSARADSMRQLINLVKGEARMRWPAVGANIFSYRQCERLVGLLQANPQVFMNQHSLGVAGAANGLQQFKLAAMNDDIFIRDDVGLLVQGGLPWYSLSTANVGPVVPMESVAMHQDITNASGVATVTGRFHPIGHHLFTTGALTGCVFIMRRNPVGNVFECTHIQPNPAHWPGDGGVGGQNLQTYVQGLGIVGNPTFWGRHNYGMLGTTAVTIIGIRSGGGLWNVYAQRYDRTTRALLGVDHILANG